MYMYIKILSCNNKKYTFHFSFPEFYYNISKIIKNYMFFNQFDTILLITDSISMKSDFNKIDNNTINNKIIT